MANKKLLQDLNGKIKEIASSSLYYDDVDGKLIVNRLQFSTASLDLPSGILSTDTSRKLSSSAASDNQDIISWDNTNKKWVSRQDDYNIQNSVAAGDVIGTYNNATVRNISNVTSGTLKVANGGTGLSSSLVSTLGTGSALLVGHGTNAMTFIKHVDQGDLSKKPVLAINQDGNSWSYVTQSALTTSVQVDVFDTPGQFIWNKPTNTKMIRVLTQGAGGGGGSGANRNQAVAALGGAGGAAGAFVDSGLFQIEDSATSINGWVGQGGSGGSYSITGAAGFVGAAGQSSSFGNSTSGPFIAANGGLGGGSGSLGTSAVSSGGASVTASSNIYDIINYNNTKVLNTNLNGINNSTTIGNDGNFQNIGNYYGSGGGSSGASLLASNYTTNYNGGNSAAAIALFNLENTLADAVSNISLTLNGGFQTGGTAFLTALTSLDKKFGSYCLKFNGGNADFISTPLHDRIGAGDFTMELWIKFNSYSSNTAIFVLNHGAVFNVLNGVLSFNGINYTGVSVPLNSWTHIALVRTNGSVYSYVNGVKSSNAITFNSDFSTFTSKFIRFGYYYYVRSGLRDTRDLDGYIDDIRIAAAALYNSTFVPPSKQLELINNNGGTTTSLNALPAVSSSVTSSIGNFTYTNNKDIAIASGGGGGASAAVTEVFDSGTLALAHFNISNPLKDNSVYNNTCTTGSYSRIVSTASLGIPQLSGTFSDGMLSSSYGTPNGGATYDMSPGYNLANNNFTAEAWFYLINTGSYTADARVTCQLITIGNQSLLLNSTGQLGTYFNTYNTATSLTPTMNRWNHIALVRTSTTQSLIYLNGVASLPITILSTANINGSLRAGSDNSLTNPNGYIKEFRVLNRALTAGEITTNYNARINNQSGSYTDPTPLQLSYPGGLGSNGAWGSGGGGGGASTNNTGSLVGTQQGGNGGNGYVAVISYKDF